MTDRWLRLVADEGLTIAHDGAKRCEVAGDEAERAGLDKDVAERRRLHGAGDNGQRARVGGELAQEPVGGPPPTTWTTSILRPVSRLALSTALAYAAARLSRMHRTSADRFPGTGWPAARSSAAIRAGMSPGAMNAGESGSYDGAAGRQRSGGLEQRLERLGRPRPLPRPKRLLSSHRPVTLRWNRLVPSTPPSFVKSAARLASVRIGAADSTPTSDQVPLEM